MKLSIESVQLFLIETDFELNPTQDKLSFPMIVRYYNLLMIGETPPNIKVDNKSIVDGHHRYISGCIAGKFPSTQNYIKPNGTSIYLWSEVLVVADDYLENYDKQ